MAMQAGMGLSRILLLVGAGYTGTIVLRNGRLSEILDELQGLVKGLEKSKGESGGDSDVADALTLQVRRLAMEVRQLASARPITVVNGSGQGGNVSNLLVPAAAAGAIGYGLMWWKGYSFSDLMYVTKKNMANAVSSMTKQLDQVSAALAAAKRHLTQRIENLDGKLDEHKVLSTEIKNEVSDVRGKISNIGYDLESLKGIVWGLDGKMSSLENKQNFACAGVMYLCEFVADKENKMPEFLKDAPKPKRHFLGYKEGLKQFMETIESGNFDQTQTEANLPNDTNALDNFKGLSRTASIKCL
ncbi:uncharacterized protein LOC109827977 [Asparagus officinalis]|uniref:uncharacterized protein LOC109827977 n=1 Tax=Asparagus officinalis TaxID=4686 RepID=UPI00098E44A6|nr:uncharacterized protein LOC109827977 [Asparagus officinalis]